MSQPYDTPEEQLEAAKRYQQELIATADRRIALLKYDLRKAKQSRAQRLEEHPMFLYMHKDIPANQRQEIKDAELQELNRYNALRAEIDDPSLNWQIVTALVIIFIGFEWYFSTSYENFCYKLGHHIVLAVFGALLLSGAIWTWHRIKRIRAHAS